MTTVWTHRIRRRRSVRKQPNWKWYCSQKPYDSRGWCGQAFSRDGVRKRVLWQRLGCASKRNHQETELLLRYLLYCSARLFFKAQWSLYVPPSLTFTTLRSAHTAVFMCFVWISEQTAIISLYNIKWLVFITETGCVYCAVRTGYLNLIHVKFGISILNYATRY